MPKKKTHEEYVAELAIKNPNVEVVDTYINAVTKILHRCKIHNYTWSITPSNLLKGDMCPECRKISYRKKRLKTTEQYIQEVKEITDDIIVIDEYIDARTPIMHYCKKHDVYWKTVPDRILQGCGCKECGKEKQIRTTRKTTSQYIGELEKLNKKIIPLEKYTGALILTKHKCLVCGFEWSARPGNVLNSTGCPRCAKQERRTAEKYIEELKEINPSVVPLEDYITVNDPIKHLCTIHNFEWVTTPASTLQGCGCPICSKEKISNALKKTNEQYLKELNDLDKKIIPCEEYVYSLTPINHKCLICGNVWKVAPAHILNSTGCPRCNSSKGEKLIQQWLKSNNISYQIQFRFPNCRDKKALPFDFYLTEHNICIEYDGEQHFRAIDYFGGEEYLRYVQKHDAIKTEYCKENGIPLLRIPYYKFDNIEEELNNFLFN